MRGRSLTLAAALAFVAAYPTAQASYQPPRQDPDWPCVQRKVPYLTPAAVWTGPAVEGLETDWRNDPGVAELVGALSQRRVPLNDAEAEIAAFAETLQPEEREERLTLLFAGLFDSMNAERSEIIEGIERYARRQKSMAVEIRAQAAELQELRDGGAEPGELARKEEGLIWATRLFDERRASLAYVCEVPRIVEQRLFSLGRAITAELEG